MWFSFASYLSFLSFGLLFQEMGPIVKYHGIVMKIKWTSDLDRYIDRIMLLLLSHFSRVQPHRRQPNRLPRPWDSPDNNTGVGCHFLLQCMKVKSESEVTLSCLTLSDPRDCSLPGASVHGIFQARVLEWGAIAFSVHLLRSWVLEEITKKGKGGEK